MIIEIASIEVDPAGLSLFKGLAAAVFDFEFVDLGQVTDDSSSRPRILYVAAKDLKAVEQQVASASLMFDLVVCTSEQVLSYTGLLSHCAAVLVGPDDSETLADAITGTVVESEQAPGLSTLTLNFIGESEPVNALMKVIDRVAQYDAPVLISGETGTGKELIARGIHYESMRRDYPFVPVNCGALNDELLLSELFGYEQGAFTDAKHQHAGLVAQASDGSLFLDEVDSLSLKAQTALLRFLQDQEYRPLGSEKVLRSNVRIICATNRELSTLVDRGEFREDLYYRLRILDVALPALRERREDIPLLIDFFQDAVSRKYGEPKKQLHPLTERWMVNEYSWPGNVRELENYLHRIFILSEGNTIYVPEVMGHPLNIKVSGRSKRAQTKVDLGKFQDEKAFCINQFERDYLSNLMSFSDGNVSRAARIAGKERRALGRLLKKHGIDSSNYRRACH